MQIIAAKAKALMAGCSGREEEEENRSEKQGIRKRERKWKFQMNIYDKHQYDQKCQRFINIARRRGSA